MCGVGFPDKSDFLLYCTIQEPRRDIAFMSRLHSAFNLGVDFLKTFLENYYNGLKNKTVTFCGIGVSNTPMIIKLAKMGISVSARDKRDEQKLGEKAKELKDLGVKLVLGEHYLDGITEDIVFRTPGLPFNTPQLVRAREQGKKVTSEMEEFFDLCPAKIFAVTGSDGKTTTTTIISELLKTTGKRVFLGGNIGTPLLDKVDGINEDDFVVVELSSFQLISMKKGPFSAVVTNVAPNHLDIHKDMQEYIDAKRNILFYQQKDSRTTLNFENDITRGFEGDVKGRCLFFSDEHKIENGAFCDQNGDIYFAENGNNTFIMNKSDIRIPGGHNVQNYLAAISAVWGFVEKQNIVKVAENFGGVEHRIEFVRELDGVKWYNDSIATSPTRAIAGLNSFNQKLIIIAGGYDKHIPFDPFAKKAITNIKLLILTGATADAIESCIRKQEGFEQSGLEIIRVKDIKEAVEVARSRAKAGDIVSLSPACASFDAFPNFAVRGNYFKQLVNEL